MGIEEIKRRFEPTLKKLQKVPRGNRRYPNKFKKAVSLAATDSDSIKKLANTFMVHPATIRVWKNEYLSKQASHNEDSDQSNFTPIKVAKENKPIITTSTLMIETPLGIKISIALN